MRRPRDSASRDRESPYGLWRFALDRGGVAGRRGGSARRCRMPWVSTGIRSHTECASPDRQNDTVNAA
jgi:hypothetical protein